jgi:hypothetical protein
MAGIGTDRKHTSNVVGEALKRLVSAGAVGNALAAPSVSILLEQLLEDTTFHNKVDYDLLATYLKSRRLIESSERPDGTIDVLVTLGGWRRVQKFNINNMRILQPETWDGQWRMVMFDIPEKHKVARNALSQKLKILGLLQWQRSVWVHPYECESEVMTIAQVYNIDQYVTYLTFETSNKNTWLYRNFSHLLPS